jgi:hypothetical protein
MARAIRAGYSDAEGLRQGINLEGVPWSQSGTPTLVLGKEGAKSEGTRSLIWEAGSRQGTHSRFEGTLLIREIDSERTELRIDGRLRPPQQQAQEASPLIERLSRATIRTSLREIAKALEHRTER